jgi:hypothetical protein
LFFTYTFIEKYESKHIPVCVGEPAHELFKRKRRHNFYHPTVHEKSPAATRELAYPSLENSPEPMDFYVVFQVMKTATTKICYLPTRDIHPHKLL